MLKAWRATHTRGQRIPDEIWQAAAEVAREHGLSRTATALRLGYYDLQRRLSTGPMLTNGVGLSARFVELSPPVPSGGRGEYGACIEMVAASGARLSVRLADASASDLLPIVDLFLRHRG